MIPGGWRASGDRPAILHCPIALRLVDDFSGGAPVGDVRLDLDFNDGAEWRASEVQPVRTASGLFAYPGLGRHGDPVATPSFRVRVRIAAEAYRPAYGVNADGLEYDVPTYNDVTPPAFVPVMPESVFLLPASPYSFPGFVRVLRGTVATSGTGEPVADARVSTGVERVLSDERGAFSLPLRWQASDALITVLAEHPRTGMSGSVSLQLPDVLASNQQILVT
jgi:hypothetical protein